jgi:acyl-CoA dehydrogenase
VSARLAGFDGVERRDPALSVDDLGFLFADRHRELATRVRETVRGVIDLEAESSEGDALHRAIVRRLGEDGLLEEFSPKSGSTDLRALCLIREGLAWASGSADSLFAVQGLGTYPLHAFGSEEQKARYLPRLLSGHNVAAFGLTEPEAGTDVAAMHTVAVKEVVNGATRYRLTGKKTFISNAPICDHAVVFANVDPAAGRKGITAFLVRRDAPGLTVKGPIPMVAEHSIGELELDGCLVEESDVLGATGQGFSIAMATLDTFRVTVGAAAVGMARRALDEATHRAVARKQFGKPIGEFQQIQAYLADSIAELDASRLLVLRAARLKDDGAKSITEEAAIAKMYATEAAQKIIDRAVQIHGGLGVTRGVPVERLYREIRALRIYEGTTEIQRVVVSSRMLARERERGGV